MTSSCVLVTTYNCFVLINFSVIAQHNLQEKHNIVHTWVSADGSLVCMNLPVSSLFDR